MTEQPEISVTKTYSLTMAHIAKVSDLAQRLGVSQGEVLRRAIDALYAEKNSPTEPQTAPQAA